MDEGAGPLLMHGPDISVKPLRLLSKECRRVANSTVHRLRLGRPYSAVPLLGREQQDRHRVQSLLRSFGSLEILECGTFAPTIEEVEAEMSGALEELRTTAPSTAAGIKALRLHLPKPGSTCHLTLPPLSLSLAFTSLLQAVLPALQVS